MQKDLNDNLRNFSPVNILLIEDNPGDARLIQEVFKEGKILNKLDVVIDGEEALLFLRKTGRYKDSTTPNLILLDLSLSKKGGREILSEIKSDPDLRTIPVIMLLTSLSEKDILMKGVFHANSYIIKPVDFNEFINAIKVIGTFWLRLVSLPGK